MGFLSGKNILITGLLSDRSIAYGVAQACKTQGARLAFTYQNDRFYERTKKLAADFDTDLLFKCDVTNEPEVLQAFADIDKVFQGQLDGVLHSIAYTAKEGLSGSFVNNVTREIYQNSNEISAYSLALLAKHAQHLLAKSHGSMVALTYLGGERVVANYNMAGVAKAALDATMRYIAYDLGAVGIRVNAVSAGPIKTLAASGIAGFSKMLDYAAKNTPLKRNITALEVGNAAAFLFSDLASGITGEILYVDAGYNIMAGAAVSDE